MTMLAWNSCITEQPQSYKDKDDMGYYNDGIFVSTKNNFWIKRMAIRSTNRLTICCIPHLLFVEASTAVEMQDQKLQNDLNSKYVRGKIVITKQSYG